MQVVSGLESQEWFSNRWKLWEIEGLKAKVAEMEERLLLANNYVDREDVIKQIESDRLVMNFLTNKVLSLFSLIHAYLTMDIKVDELEKQKKAADEDKHSLSTKLAASQGQIKAQQERIQQLETYVIESHANFSKKK